MRNFVICFEEWIQVERGYSYYLQSRFAKMLGKTEIILQGLEGSVIVLYKGYAIASLVCINRSIVLVDFKYCVDSKSAVIQKKLHHEYAQYFHLCFSEEKSTYDGNRGYIVTQYNMCYVIDYLVNVFGKIDNGFDRYANLLAKQDIEIGNASFLKVEINNAFSVEDLNRLLDAYNKIYALLYDACMNGHESITEINLDEVRDKPSMIVESIHIGSPGFFVAVGEAIVVELLKEVIIAAFRGEYRIAEERRKELVAKAESDRKIQDNEKIIELINQLDDVLERKTKCRNTMTDYYLNNQMCILIKEIEELQGTRHIDLAI